MPRNNNQKVQSAAARLARLPLVHSACTRLSVFYTYTKCSHPNLRSVCEVLESSVTAVVSPVIVKLEPQRSTFLPNEEKLQVLFTIWDTSTVSIANDVACRSLDWLEMAFPVLHAPTEQVVATAKNKMHEIQHVVSVTAHGTRDCVEHTVAWLKGGTQQADGDQADQSLVERAITVASVGLDSALMASEALLDRVLPPTDEDKVEEAQLVEGFESATLRRRYPERLVSLAVKLCRRTYHVMQSVQVMESLSRSTGLVRDLPTSWLTLTQSVHVLPQYLQHQLMSFFFFISQMYNLSFPPPPRHKQPDPDRSGLNVAETSTHKGVVPFQPPPPPKPICRFRKPNKMPAFDNGCNVKGCVKR